MNWRRWKLGLFIAVGLALLTAGAGLTDNMGWRGFISVFCVACLGQLGTFLVKHPVDDVTFDTTHFTKPTDPTQPDNKEPK